MFVDFLKSIKPQNEPMDYFQEFYNSGRHQDFLLDLKYYGIHFFFKIFFENLNPQKQFLYDW